MIHTLSDSDIGCWVTYATYGKIQRGKIKSFDNEKGVAFIVYNANGNWDADHWKDYTAARTNYRELTLARAR